MVTRMLWVVMKAFLGGYLGVVLHIVQCVIVGYVFISDTFFSACSILTVASSEC